MTETTKTEPVDFKGEVDKIVDADVAPWNNPKTEALVNGVFENFVKFNK
jgi:hypothetical protein